MPLLVKPNWRRMQYMRDSPSEGSVSRYRIGLAGRLPWERVLVAVGIAGVIVIGLILMAGR